MAAKPPKPPENNINNKTRMVRTKNSGLKNSIKTQCQTSTDQKSNCSCTNIGIRQLFYEMKQIFPTVPDDIVNQCVIENCHDRENCMKVLTNELTAHPTPAQSYPSQSIRGANSGSGGGVSNTATPTTPNRKPPVPVRPAPTPKQNMVNSSNSDFSSLPRSLKSTMNSLKQEIGNKICSVKAYNSNANTSDTRPPVLNADTLKKPHVPERPTTLNLRDPMTSSPNTRTFSRPTRTAPLPPIAPASGPKSVPTPPPPKYPPSPPPASLQQSTSDPGNQSLSSGQSVQSPMSFSDSSESEISVNISLSPSSSDRSRLGVSSNAVTPTRCITTISVQPEPAYTRAIAGDSGAVPPIVTTPHRSYTSLNLTLRKPSDSPQSPIDITAGSVLKYSSTRYDAINGCEQNFHITVSDGGGSVTSSRIRPRSCHYDPETMGTPSVEQPFTLRTGISMPNVASQNVNLGDASVGRDGSAMTAAQDEIVRRQQARKTKLLNEVKNKRQQLEEMNKEINILESPISPNVCDRLDREIEILRCDCERICQEINYRNGNAGVSFESVMNNMYNGQQATPARQPPPPVPPALARYRSRTSPNFVPSVVDPTDFHQNPYQRSQSYPFQVGSIPNRNVDYNQTDYNNANYMDDNGPPWTCSMCTFQNYPLLNKCEGCDNVRIIPGTVQIVPSTSAPHINTLLSSANNTSPPAARFARNLIAQPHNMLPVVPTHNAPMPSNSVVNNDSNHNHLHSTAYQSDSASGNRLIAHDSNNAGRAPNMHQIIAYPAVMNPNFMIPQ